MTGTEYQMGVNQSGLLLEFSARTPPTPLYHYTGRAALVQILESRTVHASAIRYLNDATEFQYACTLAEKVLASRRSAAKGDDVC